jgi:alkyldihydroxyacetonephosphate synthase
MRKKKSNLPRRAGYRARHLRDLMRFVGSDNVQVDDFSAARAMHSVNITAIFLRMRMGKVTNPARCRCHAAYRRRSSSKSSTIATLKRIAVVPWGGGTSVTRALEADKGGIALDLTVQLQRHSVAERRRFDGDCRSRHSRARARAIPQRAGYTCGHFPQSFEFATVGGWLAARVGRPGFDGLWPHRRYGGRLSRRYTRPGSFHAATIPAASVGADIQALFSSAAKARSVSLARVTLRVRKLQRSQCTRSSHICSNRLKQAVDCDARDDAVAGDARPISFASQTLKKPKSVLA